MKKQMFKYFSLPALSVAFAMACTPTPAEPGPEPVMASEGIELKVDKVTDYGCDISLKPKGAANYYGYMVIASNEVVPFDSLGFYRGAYAKKGLKFELFKYASVKDTVIAFSGLKPNSDYVVYAVSSSTTGVPSKLVSTQIKTTDTGKPELLKAEGTDKGQISLVFSEKVTAAPGAVLTVKYYAPFSIEYLTAANPKPSLGSVDITSDKLKFSGDTVKAVVTGMPGGARYSVHAAEGAFLDVKNNTSAKIAKGFFRLADAPFKLGKLEVPDTLRTVKDSLLFSFGANKLGLVPYGGKLRPGVDVFVEDGAKGSLEYYFREGERLSYEKIELASDNYSALKDLSKGRFKLTEAPVPGDSVAVTIPMGAYIDIFGNPNAEEKYSFVYYHDLSDFIGTYRVTGRDSVSKSEIKDFMVIAKSDKQYITWTENGANVQKPVNLMIKYWLKTMAGAGMTNVYGYWDKSNKKITFYQGNAPFYTDATTLISYFFSKAEGAVITFSAATGGYLSSPSSHVLLYVDDNKVREIVPKTFQAERISKSTAIDAGANLPVDI